MGCAASTTVSDTAGQNQANQQVAQQHGTDTAANKKDDAGRGDSGNSDITELTNNNSSGSFISCASRRSSDVDRRKGKHLDALRPPPIFIKPV